MLLIYASQATHADDASAAAMAAMELDEQVVTPSPKKKARKKRRNVQAKACEDDHGHEDADDEDGGVSCFNDQK